MRKYLTIACIVIFVVSFSQVAGALSYTFAPDDGGTSGPNSNGTSNMANDLWDLEHGRYYTWGINLEVPDGEVIVGASLVFNDIRNWRTEVNDLWVTLLNDAPTGTKQYWDGESGQRNFFRDQGLLLNQEDPWHNLPNTPQDIEYMLNEVELAALNEYSADGFFGLGFDPDCHFYNNGVTLTIETQQVDPVPEPGTMLLLGAGLLGLIGYRKKIKK